MKHVEQWHMEQWEEGLHFQACKRGKDSTDFPFFSVFGKQSCVKKRKVTTTYHSVFL